MGWSYRSQVHAAIARVLPVDDFRFVDRRSGDRWGWYPLAFVWLLQILSRGMSLAERFEESRLWLRWLSPRLRLAGTYQGFVKALRRRADVLTFWLHTAFQERMRNRLRDDDLIGGWRPLAVDGTRFDCPRSCSCQRRFRPAGRDKSPPQLVLTSLWHLGVHCWWDGRVAAATTSERELLRDMLDGLPPRALLVGDAGFVGYELCADLMDQGVAFLLRVGANVALLTRLGVCYRENRDTVYLWPRKHRGTRPLVLRLIVVGTGRRRVFLLTNVLSRTALSRRQAADFYRRRWSVETAYRAVKQTLARRRLHSRASDLAVWELVGVFLGGWALSLVSLFARGRARFRRPWSPARTAETLRQAFQHAGRCSYSLLRALANALLKTPITKRRKTRQDWPHKKNEPPCGAPIINRATASLAQRAQQFAALSA